MAAYKTIDAAAASTDTADGAFAVPQTELAAPGILDFAATASAFQIDWATYKQSHFLDEAGLALITRFVQCVDDKAIQTILAEKGQELFDVLIGLLSKVSKVETLQYLLTVLMRVIETNTDSVALFHKSAKGTSVPSWQAFLRILSTKDDPYVVHQAARVIIAITTDGVEPLPQREQQVFFMWICNETKSKDKDASLLALKSLCKFLRCPVYRRSFYEHAEGIATLKHIFRMDTTSNIQAQYLAAYCAWVISFDPHVADRLENDGSHLTADAAVLLKTSKKDKVIRMIIAFFANMVSIPTSLAVKKQNATAMITLKLLPAVESMLKVGIVDVEATKHAEFLKEQLTLFYEEMSTFDEYSNEVTCGRLEWSPAHQSERFWRENATRLNEDKHKLLKILIQLLEMSKDPQILAVAAHDIGQYVRFYPRGKLTLEKLKGKTPIMKLMTHTDQSVRYESLLAVQKMMTQNWSSLGQAMGKGTRAK
jgi:V-type H+-transporting ATPase subunit H